tara:strand:- start:138 stop:404 length:267 start_codon:yes stop_codon:yes gene_type:complete
MSADEAQNYGKKYGRTWTREDLESKVRKVEVLNFAKRKKAALKDDIHDLQVWTPGTDSEMKAFLTGYWAACDDLHKWVMGRYEESDGK